MASNSDAVWESFDSEVEKTYAKGRVGAAQHSLQEKGEGPPGNENPAEQVCEQEREEGEASETESEASEAEFYEGQDCSEVSSGSEDECVKCGSLEHTIQDCEQFVCLGCGAQGHARVQCPKDTIGTIKVKSFANLENILISVENTSTRSSVSQESCSISAKFTGQSVAEPPKLADISKRGTKVSNDSSTSGPEPSLGINNASRVQTSAGKSSERERKKSENILKPETNFANSPRERKGKSPERMSDRTRTRRRPESRTDPSNKRSRSEERERSNERRKIRRERSAARRERNYSPPRRPRTRTRSRDRKPDQKRSRSRSSGRSSRMSARAKAENTAPAFESSIVGV